MAHVVPTLLLIILCMQDAFCEDLHVKTRPSPQHNSSTNATTTKQEENRYPTLADNKGLLQRTLYVAVGVSAIVAIYFIIKTIKTRGKRKLKKYGVIHGAADMEMQPLEKHMDEDEEDVTVFDVNHKKPPK